MDSSRHIRTANDELHRLEQSAFTLIGQREEVRLRLGCVFQEIKELVGHGQWKLYFKRKFSHRISLKSANNYMRLARGEQYVMSKAKGESLSPLPPTTDPEAVEDQEDVAKDQREIAGKERRTFRPPPVRTRSAAEREAMEELWHSNRDEVEKRSLELWRQLRGELCSRKEKAA